MAAEDGVVRIPANMKEFVTYAIETPLQQEAPIEIDQKLGVVKISYRKEILKSIPLIAGEDIQRVEASLPAVDSIVSNMGEHKNMWLIILILLSLLAVQFLYIIRLRRSLKKTDPISTQFIKQRLDKILKPDEDD